MSSMVRVWIAGPRGWENPEPIKALINTLIGNYGIGRLLLMTGGAPGVDTLVEDEAIKLNVHCVRVRACWPVGRQAGPIRNALIARELEPDALVALHYFDLNPTNHRGTQNAIKQAKKYGILTKVLRFPPHVALPSSVGNGSPMGNRARAQQGLPAKPPKQRRPKRNRTA